MEAPGRRLPARARTGYPIHARSTGKAHNVDVRADLKTNLHVKIVKGRRQLKTYTDGLEFVIPVLENIHGAFQSEDPPDMDQRVPIVSDNLRLCSTGWGRRKVTDGFARQPISVGVQGGDVDEGNRYRGRRRGRRKGHGQWPESGKSLNTDRHTSACTARPVTPRR